ncbi:MAG: hypothetical protein IPJ20_25795 [Flammeovirgaceae bacterium]|nr:hypothetical protein [Flammeovirgaceae bacterium]
MKTTLRIQLAFAFIAVLLASNVLAQTAQFHLIKKTVIGVKVAGIFIGRSRKLEDFMYHSTQVEVLSTDTHEKIGVIPNLRKA